MPSSSTPRCSTSSRAEPASKISRPVASLPVGKARGGPADFYASSYVKACVPPERKVSRRDRLPSKAFQAFQNSPCSLRRSLERPRRGCGLANRIKGGIRLISSCSVRPPRRARRGLTSLTAFIILGGLALLIDAAAAARAQEPTPTPSWPTSPSPSPATRQRRSAARSLTTSRLQRRPGHGVQRGADRPHPRQHHLRQRRSENGRR